MKKTLIAILAAALLLTALTPASFAEEGKKVLNWFIEGEVTTMDSSKVYDTLSGEAVAYFTDTLYRLDSEANAVPNLAVDLPQISEDGTVVTVTIRDDAKYADGTPVTAGDIEYAVKRAADPAVGSQATSLPAIKNLDAVRAGEAPLDELGVKALSDTVKKKSEPIPTGMTFGFSTSAFRADSDAKRRNHSCVSGTPARHSGQIRRGALPRDNPASG